MAVLTEHHALQEIIGPEEQQCFFCGEHFDLAPIRRPIVYWFGTYGYLFLHLPCAYHLIGGLQNDLRRLQ